MQQIVNDAVRRFKYIRELTREQLEAFVREHPLYDPNPQSELPYRNEIVNQVEKSLPAALRTEDRRLALHYSEDNNKPLFEIFRIILQHPRGLSYQGILNQMT